MYRFMYALYASWFMERNLMTNNEIALKTNTFYIEIN